MSDPSPNLVYGQSLALIRKRLGLTQAEMGTELGLSLRAYQDLEKSDGPVRAAYVLAAKHLSLQRAVEFRNPDLATHETMRLASQLAILAG